jgi:hypothetical protein
MHTLGYLQPTNQSTLILKPTKPMQIKNYIVAAFTAHHESESHSGVALFIAGVLEQVQSTNLLCTKIVLQLFRW